MTEGRMRGKMKGQRRLAVSHKLVLVLSRKRTSKEGEEAGFFSDLPR
jgi:hypothetical protein